MRFGQFYGQTRRRTYRGNHRYASHKGFLDQFKPGPTAQKEDGGTQRDDHFLQGGAYHLVKGIVSTDVLTGQEQVSINRKQPGGMNSPGMAKQRLRRGKQC